MEDLQRIWQARRRIAPYINKTPMMSCGKISSLCGANVQFLCEHLQKTGSFKVRGALNNLLQLPGDALGSGVVASSSGNHAQAVAFAAKTLGVACMVCMPDWANRQKIEAVLSYGGKIEIVAGSSEDTERRARELSAKKGYAYIHPFDDWNTIFGQGTIGLELLERFLDMDMVVVPVSGGGLLGGVALAIKKSNPQIKVVGVMPEGSDAMGRSVCRGKLVTLRKVDTCADGLTAKRAGEKGLLLAQKYVDDLVLVSEEELKEALLQVLIFTKQLIEPASAAVFAALMHNKVSGARGKNIALVASGGNCSMDTLKEIVANSINSSVKK